MFKALFIVFALTSQLFAEEIRLFSGEKHQAGLEIALKQGFKTYWRYPGDNGVPPTFNFEGSINVKDVEVLYPTPVKFADGLGFSIGYTKTVVFPLHITPLDDKKPITLNLALDYAICETLCMPMSAKASLTLKEQVAIKADIPEKRPDMAKIIAFSEKEMTFSLKEAGDILVEGPNEKWALPFPLLENGLYKLVFDGYPKSEGLKGQKLRLTILREKGAYETDLQLP